MDFQFPNLPWEEFGFVKPCIHAVLGQAGVESARKVTVRVGVAEEDIEGHLGSTDFINGLHNGFTDGNGLWLACGNYTCED